MADMKQKETYINELKEKLSKAKVVIVAGCEGVTVEEMNAVRKSIRNLGDEMKVVKNKLARRALHDPQHQALEPFLTGENTVTFGYHDEAAPVKALFEFAEKAKKFQFKAGLLGDKVLTVKELEALSKLPNKQQMLSMLLSTMVGPIRNMLSVSQGPIRKFAYALQALKEQKEKAAA